MIKELDIACCKQGWTKKEIAERLNISESYLYKLLSGKRCSEKRLREIEKIIEEEKELDLSPYLFNQVKHKCLSLNISFSTLASSLNISLSYLYDLLNGRRENEKIKKELEYFVKK